MEHAGTVADPIPRSFLYTRTDKSTGEKKVYCVGTGGSGGGGGETSPALPPFKVISDESEVDLTSNQIFVLVE